MPVNWKSERKYEEIIYETYNGIAKITINRPEVHNAFTPRTVMELIDAFSHARDDATVGVIVLQVLEKKPSVQGETNCTGPWWICR